MDLNLIKDSLVTNAYHIDSSTKVPLHKHDDKDEVFYCIKGVGVGVLENEEIALSKGKEFIVKAGTLHSLRSNEDLYVVSFLIPVVK